MKSKLTSVLLVVPVYGLAALAATSIAGAACDASLVASYDQASRVVGSLRPDKPSQMRVFAVDGSVYTAGEAQWLKSQLHEVSVACQRGDGESAGALLSGLKGALIAHHSMVQD